MKFIKILLTLQLVEYLSVICGIAKMISVVFPSSDLFCKLSG